jgi:type I restriction enzyme, S subunit
VSDLPEGWEWVSAGNVAQVQGGIQKQPKRRPVSNRYPFLRVANVMRGRLDLADVHEVELFDGEIDRYRLRSGDLLVVEGNGSPDQVGRAAQWLGEIEDCVHQNHLIRVRPSSSIDPRYLAYYWNAPQTTSYLRSVASSTSGLYVLTASKVRSVRIPLPPLDEQSRIVAVIEEQFSRLDAGSAALRSAQQKLKRIRDASMFAATLGQLIPQDPEDEPASNLISRTKPTGRFRRGKQLPGDLRALPPGWSWALMGSLAQRITVGFVGPMKHEYVSQGIPFLRSQNVRQNRFDPQGLRFISPTFHEQLGKSRLTPGDVVVVRSGNVGTACVVPDSLGEANCADLVIIQRPEAIDPHYAALYMNSLARSHIQAGKVGVALAHFNTQSVAELPVPVPPLNEQKKIVAKARELISATDILESDINQALKIASALRSSILAVAFSGKLT